MDKVHTVISRTSSGISFRMDDKILSRNTYQTMFNIEKVEIIYCIAFIHISRHKLEGEIENCKGCCSVILKYLFNYSTVRCKIMYFSGFIGYRLP